MESPGFDQHEYGMPSLGKEVLSALVQSFSMSWLKNTVKE